MKFRILYQSAEPLRARTTQGASEQLSARSDDLDEYALQADLVTATLQKSEDGKNWADVVTIKP